MTRLTLALLAVAAAFPARAADRPYPVADFDRVVIEGPYRVHLVVGRPTTARANGSREGLDRVSITSSGQTLRIRPQRNVWGAGAGTDPGPVTIELTTRNLRSARLLGPATLEVEGARGLSVEFMVEGSGTLRATRLAVDGLSLGLLGSGSLELAGTAETLRGQFQGTGNIAAAALAAGSATVNTNTAGNVALQVNGRAEIIAYGVGTVSVAGRPACTVTGPAASRVACPAASNQGQPR